MKSDAVSVKVKHTGIRRLTHWPTKRVTHAMTNLEKLKKAFSRCGSEVDSYSQISKLSNDVCEASDAILAAFSGQRHICLHAKTIKFIPNEWTQSGPISIMKFSDVLRTSLR